MLKSIHFLLTYMCNFECDHCFLYCSPSAKGTFTLKQICETLEEAAKIGTVKQIAFEGGEPFLFYPLMLEGIKTAHKLGFKTAIETNSYWATSDKDTDLWLIPLLEAGLTKLEVSDDAFHHEEEKDNPAKRAHAAAVRLNISVNTLTIDKPIDHINVEKEQVKGEPIAKGYPKLRGRAIEKLIEGLPRKPWEEHTECPLENLGAPDRVHIDAYGNVHLCQGLSMGNIWKTSLSELVENYNVDKHPICSYLIKGGPALLAKEYNVQHEDTYVDACHFCSMVCLALIDRFPQYLTPKQVYGLED